MSRGVRGFFGRSVPALRRCCAPAARCAALFLAFVLVAQTSYAMVFPPSKSALVWLPSGLTLALFVIAREVRWVPWLLVIVLAEMAVVTRHGLPLHVAFAWGIANGLLPLSAALIIRRFAAVPFALCRVRDVLLFVGAGAAAAIPGTLVGAASAVAWLSMPSFWDMAISWWSSDVLGIVLVAPLVLACATRHPRPSGSALEALCLLAALLSVGWLVFGGNASDRTRALSYLVIPFTAWAALRFGIRGATLATIVLDFLAVWQTMEGRGPFAGTGGSAAARVLEVQLFIVTVSLFTLLLAVVVAQHLEARAAAERAEDRAEFLSSASAALSASLSRDAILTELARLCVRRIAHLCVIHTVEEGAMPCASVAHADPSQEATLLRMRGRGAPDKCARQPAALVLGTREPLLLTELGCDEHEHDAMLGAFGVQSSIAVPLVVRGRMLGVLTLYATTPGQPYGPPDLALAEDLARRAAVAIDNACLYRDAQEAIRAREEFLAIASHELNTPITSLLLAVQLLKANVDGPLERIERLLDKLPLVERQTKKLARLVDELLSVSRITAGRLELSLSEVDLAAVVRGAAERFSEDLARSGCQVTIRADEDVIGRWDAARLEQVVVNLITNAIKYGDKRPIEIAVGGEAGTASLVVRDHGIGIPADRLPHIFARFERAVSARAYSGLGLGLYIVRTIVEAHGGSVRAESTLGSGSTFTVELPRASPPAVEAAHRG